ncbi:hypothetical protein [Arcicella rigui]|uniref:DUF2281 domain-containing protein n=1 Tax=Arcicella rigui TaxID=797020 RepID=A0ABU5Q597_9BACT|nr:hypothetical protein [Arcicella rigui]MEA5138016.1 hypothetical protein [Arcicella rigui]
MEAILNFNIPLTFQQIAEIVKQLPKKEQADLVKILQKEVMEKETIQTHFATESILAKEWLNPEEESAWQHL